MGNFSQKHLVTLPSEYTTVATDQTSFCRGGSGLIFFGLGSGLGFILWAFSGLKNLPNKLGFSWARALLHK
jgi:hypothetical protein